MKSKLGIFTPANFFLTIDFEEAASLALEISRVKQVRTLHERLNSLARTLS